MPAKKTTKRKTSGSRWLLISARRQSWERPIRRRIGKTTRVIMTELRTTHKTWLINSSHQTWPSVTRRRRRLRSLRARFREEACKVKLAMRLDRRRQCTRTCSSEISPAMCCLRMPTQTRWSQQMRTSIQKQNQSTSLCSDGTISRSHEMKLLFIHPIQLN